MVSKRKAPSGKMHSALASSSRSKTCDGQMPGLSLPKFTCDISGTLSQDHGPDPYPRCHTEVQRLALTGLPTNLQPNINHAR